MPLLLRPQSALLTPNPVFGRAERARGAGFAPVRVCPLPPPPRATPREWEPPREDDASTVAQPEWTPPREDDARTRRVGEWEAPEPSPPPRPLPTEPPEREPAPLIPEEPPPAPDVPPEREPEPETEG